MTNTIRIVRLLIAIVVATMSLQAAAADPTNKDIDAYFIGNSLTRNIPLERLQQLFKASGGKLDYGMQLGGGHRLEQHLSMRNHGNKPGQGKYNLKAPYGTWADAFKKYTFDAVVLQPYMRELDDPIQIRNRWPYFTAGTLQAADGLIDYARGQTKPGRGRWDYEHPNPDHVATERFYIYATWPKVEQVLEQEGEKTYAAYYEATYKGGVQPCADFYCRLIDRLNAKQADLKTPVRLIPAGHVLAALDKKIRAGTLAGIEAFYDRNQKYYIQARRNNKNPSPFDPDHFQPDAGVLNFYADGVHMNDQPHNGRDSGTIGSYAAALTVYATLIGENPVGLTVDPYEMFDPRADAELIRTLQETVWEVVTRNRLTGVSVQK